MEDATSLGCACRAFLESGTCGHVDAAVEAAKAMGLRREGVKAVGFKEPVAAVKAKEVLRSAGSPTAPALGTASAECLVGVFHKAKQGCFPARLQKASKAEFPAREALAIADVPTGQRGAASGALLRPTGEEHDGRGWSPVTARFFQQRVKVHIGPAYQARVSIDALRPHRPLSL